MLQRASRLILCIALAPFTSEAQSLLGTEFQVNMLTASDQHQPAVGRGSAGHFVVAWTSDYQDGEAGAIFARTFAPDGSAVSAEVQINAFTSGDQSAPAVTVDSSGDAWIVWTSQDQDGDGDGIFGRRLSSNGLFLSAEMQLNTITAGDQSRPAITGQNSGNFTVSWQDNYGGSSEIQSRRFLADGTPAAAEVLVNTTLTNDQTAPDLAINEAGRFVVSWESFGQDASGQSIQARRQSPPAPQAQVNLFTIGDQELPAVGIDAASNAVIAWQSSGQDGSSTSVHARKINSDGMPTGAEIQVNSTSAGMQGVPDIVVSATCVASIAFQSENVDGSATAVQLREYDANLIPFAAPLRVNSFTPLAQEQPAIASDGGSNLVIVWQSDGQDGDGLGIFGRRAQSAVTTTTTTTSTTTVTTSSTTTTSSSTTTTLPPIPAPELMVVTNAAVYQPADYFQLDVCVNDHGQRLDLYVGILFPNGFTFVTFSGRNTIYAPNQVGAFENELFAGIFCVNIAQFNLPPAPFGTYVVCAWLVTPGADPTHFGNIVALDCRSFLIQP